MFFPVRNWLMEFKVGTSIMKERLVNAIVLHTLHCLGGFYDIMLIRYYVDLSPLYQLPSGYLSWICPLVALLNYGSSVLTKISWELRQGEMLKDRKKESQRIIRIITSFVG